VRCLVALGNGLVDGRGSAGALAVADRVLRAGQASAQVASSEKDRGGDGDAGSAVETSSAAPPAPPAEGDAVAGAEDGSAAASSALASPAAALRAFEAALALAPTHVGALHGAGAARFALGDVTGGETAWALAVAAFDADAFRVRGQVKAFVYPDDPPVVAAMRVRLGTERCVREPPQAPRAPVWASLTNLRAWQAENEAAEAAAEAAANAAAEAVAAGKGTAEASSAAAATRPAAATAAAGSNA